MQMVSVTVAGVYGLPQWQWQPTRYEHDPSPPITLENPVIISPDVFVAETIKPRPVAVLPM